MRRVAAGTPVKGAYSSYTAEQLVALERLKDRKFTKGVAAEGHAGQLMLPDGSLSDDVAGMIDAVKGRLGAILAGDLTSPARLAEAKVAAEKVQEVVEHIGQGRFLFIVDADLVPVVYFQCAVSHNPDLPAELPDDRDALEERAWEIAEVEGELARVIDESHAAAATGGR